MAQAGYLTIRLSEARRHAFDSIRIALRYGGPSDDKEGARMTDQACLDFALDWCLASMPERFTAKQSAHIIRLFGKMGTIPTGDQKLQYSARQVIDNSALAERVKDTHGRVTGDVDPRDGHPYTREGIADACEVCGNDERHHPAPF